MDYKTIKVTREGSICTLQIHRPQNNNTIDNVLIDEMRVALNACLEEVTIVVLKGLPHVFCFGADFNFAKTQANEGQHQDPEPLYDLWYLLATGSFITIACVEGKANAGGIGFVAACDIVLSSEQAVYSLSEMLFGLFPACVMPYLMRKIGYQKANHLTLMTKPINAKTAQEIGLVDEVNSSLEQALRACLMRVKCLSKAAITRHKRYMHEFNPVLQQMKPVSLRANSEVFSDVDNIKLIIRYVETGQMPWEK
ncbi:MAG: enoyl-CoA hydratase/isomerase [Gammaproteobacteria bacterium]|nr:enoyl-CoA hydratase/isomerase [Gammaproteobacteria bacterium]